METEPPIRLAEHGLYCPAGDFFVDPWRPVDRAVITHAHADHAVAGSRSYLTTTEGRHVLRARIGPTAEITALPYGEPTRIGRARVSLHPAGHILGSAQVRIEVGGYVAVVSGDYKTEPDPTCTTFEPVRCHLFLTESTFGLPIYRWPPRDEVFGQINAWWRGNRDAGRASLLHGYSLGKAQRLLAGVDRSIGPIYCHGAVERLNGDYRAVGVDLPETSYAGSAPRGTDFRGSLIVAPPSAHGSPWTKRFGPSSSAFASGWMMIRGHRRGRSVDRGFVLSDHVDWPSLMSVVEATGAETVWVTHGYSAPVVRWLREQGRDASTLATRYEGERDDAPSEVAETDEGSEGTDP